MASRLKSCKRFDEQKLYQFPYILIYPILEWILMVILFIDGLISYAANVFARLFGLRIPCVLCSRIDHVLAKTDPDIFYNESICEAHSQHVSSLAYCHVHQRLSDIRFLCEVCRLSFATRTKPDCDAYKSMALAASAKEDPLHIEKSSIHRCQCCGNLVRVRSSFPLELFQTLATNEGKFLQAPAPSQRISSNTVNNEDLRGSVDPSELRFALDTESEFPENECSSSTSNPDNQCKAIKNATMTEYDDLNEDAFKSPCFSRENRFFGIAQTDSATPSPRCNSRFSRRSPVEKVESGTESPNEADGETILHNLKRQVHLDRKSLISLYMELDEERNASAVAASQAMAMITRLQAEKAAVQMEALQYQRMMEEQEEYDQEALQVVKDLLMKRENENKVLEAELENYRERLEALGALDGYAARVDYDHRKLKSQCHSFVRGESECVRSPNLNEVENNGEYDHNSDQTGPSHRENGREILDESLLDFEGERSYLLDRLRMLDKKIHSSWNDAACSLSSSSDTINLKEDDRGDSNNTIITREISQLSERLAALETDEKFLKHSVRSLKKGGEGTQLLREIAQHLRELRHMENMPLEGAVA